MAPFITASTAMPTDESEVQHHPQSPPSALRVSSAGRRDVSDAVRHVTHSMDSLELGPRPASTSRPQTARSASTLHQGWVNSPPSQARTQRNAMLDSTWQMPLLETRLPPRSLQHNSDPLIDMLASSRATRFTRRDLRARGNGN